LTTSVQTSNKNITKLLQHQTSQEVTNFQIEQKQTDSQQNHNTNLHEKYAICMHQNNVTPESLPADLTMVIEHWPKLPENIKITIKTLVETTSK